MPNRIPVDIASQIEDFNVWMQCEIIASKLVLASELKPDVFKKTLKKPIKLILDRDTKQCLEFKIDKTAPFSLGMKLYELKRLPKGCDIAPIF